MEDRSLRRTNILRTENLLLGVRCHRWPFDLQVALISPPVIVVSQLCSYNLFLY